MKQSVKLGQISGIPIGMHWTVGAIAVLAGLTVYNTVLPTFAPDHGSLGYLAATVAVVAAFLASIVAHELGHSIIAQRNRVGVASITLFALGGVAALEREADTPGAAARIALAGPAVSLALGIAGIGGSFLLGDLGASALAATAALWIGIINLSLALFNLIPALPLDGGRVLQAALWHRRNDRLGATVTAARLGRLLGFVLIGFGLWQFATTGDGLWTALIGWFVASSAKSEGRRARLQLRMQRFNHVLFAPGGRSPSPAARPGTIIDVSGRPLTSDTVPR